MLIALNYIIIIFISFYYSRMVSNDSASFSLDEIKAQLAALGYGDVGQDRLEQFHTDISQLLSGNNSPAIRNRKLVLADDNQSYPKLYDYDLQVYFIVRLLKLTQVLTDYRRLISRLDGCNRVHILAKNKSKTSL